MKDHRVVCFLLGQATVAITVACIIPIVYAVINQHLNFARFFIIIASIAAIISNTFFTLGQNHRRRVEVVDSAVAMITVWIPMITIGALPFILSNWLAPINAILETASDLTSAGVGFLPTIAPYELKLWQATLMWHGSMMFITILVTLLPEVSGCFGMELSLSQGQIFSPMLGQMNVTARRVITVYVTLTILSTFLFLIAGLNVWDAAIMAMRCISTGGGEFIGAGNLYVEYAAAASMLLACGNFLLYFRMWYTATRNNLSIIVKRFYFNSEVKFLTSVIIIGTLLISFTIFNKDYLVDGNISFRMAIFHVISFVSTTGMTLRDISNAPDFDRFFLFLLVAVGGCMGSVTGGLKVIRVLVLFKITAAETSRSLHPSMMTSININQTAVPMKVVGRILSYFFLCAITLFICSVILSLSGQPFSTSVVMALACITNVGIMPGLCDSSTFMNLPSVMKLFCTIIFIVGRVEIFAFLIAASSIQIPRQQSKWQ